MKNRSEIFHARLLVVALLVLVSAQPALAGETSRPDTVNGVLVTSKKWSAQNATEWGVKLESSTNGPNIATIGYTWWSVRTLCRRAGFADSIKWTRTPALSEIAIGPSSGWNSNWIWGNRYGGGCAGPLWTKYTQSGGNHRYTSGGQTIYPYLEVLEVTTKVDTY